MNDEILSKLDANNKLLLALLALWAGTYTGNERVELVLAAKGLGYQDIATVLGKKPDAVRMLLKRSQKSPKNIQ